MAVVGVLPSYQQPKFTNGISSLAARRTLRIREKYVVLLVFAMFGLVCFGGIFFLPDMRDRVSSDGYVGPNQMRDNFENMFFPRVGAGNGSSGRNRHGFDEVDDPHNERDLEELRKRMSQNPHIGHIRGGLNSSNEEKEPGNGKSSPKSSSSNLSQHKNDNSDDSVLHESVPDSVIEERREKIKEVGIHTASKAININLWPCLRNQLDRVTYLVMRSKYYKHGT